jgi:hypothetical protein
MVRSFLIFFIFISSAQADFLGFKTGGIGHSKIPELTERLKKLKVESSPTYEESFNLLVKSIESALEEEKLYCAGETSDSAGKVLPKEQKQLCFRELKGHYLEAMDVIFDLKKKYLGLIHNRQMEKLSEIQKKLKSDIENSF